MPTTRARRATPPQANSRIITAAGQRIDLTDQTASRALAARRQDWQPLAWAFYEATGEVLYPVEFLADSVGKLTFHAAWQADDGPPIPIGDAAEPADARPALVAPVVAQAAADELARLDTTDEGLSGVMAELSVHFNVPGEGYLVGWPPTDVEPERWEVLSTDELTGTTGRWGVVRQPAAKPQDLPADAVVLRLWQRHRRFGELAWSHLRAVLDELDELAILGRMVRSTGRSRMSAGILGIPNELTLPLPAAGVEGEPQTLEQVLMDAMTTPIADEGAASAVVPVIVRGPADALDKIVHVTLERPWDAGWRDDRLFLLRRVSQGLPVPPEVVTGLAELNHWSAWAVDVQTYAAHVEPLAGRLARSVTQAFLRPNLVARGIPADVAARVCVWFDPQRLMVRPDRAGDGDAAWDRLAISDAAYREVRGFTDGDAPDDRELLWRLVSSGKLPPEVAVAVLGELLPDVTLPESISVQGPYGSERQVDIPVGEGQPQVGPPADGQPQAVVAAGRPDRARLARRLAQVDGRLVERLLVAADVTVQRAVTRVASRVIASARSTNRLRNDQRSLVRDTIANVAHDLVPATLGPTVVAALGVGDVEQIEAEVATLEPRVRAWLAAGWAETVRLLTAEGLVDVDDGDLEQAQRQAGEDRDAAWVLLAGALTATITGRLYTPSPAVDVGEQPVGVTVPPGIARATVARAGGQAVAVTPDGRIAVPAGGPATGLTSGPRAREVARYAGMILLGYEWVYGDPATRRSPFDPHWELDGVQLSDWTDDRLLTPPGYEWLGVSHMAPGDHPGCQCTWMPWYGSDDLGVGQGWAEGLGGE